MKIYDQRISAEKIKGLLGRLAYGLIFAAILPAGLILWAGALELPGLPVYQSGPIGLALGLAGLGLMAAGVASLWRRGRGLPMNAFPPVKLVEDGIYALAPHPIYLGFTLLAAGLSLLSGSATGLWLVTPLAALLSLALVVGYEKPYLEKTFGRVVRPWLGPPSADEPLTAFRRLGVALTALLLWLIAFYAFKLLGQPTKVWPANLPFEASWPVLTWTYPLYASTYILVPLSFFLIKKAADLRAFYFSVLAAMGLTTLIYLALPFVAAPRPFEIDSIWGELLALDIALDAPPVCAFPSYHVIWAVLIAHYAGLGRGRTFNAAARLWALGIALSCLSTSFHALIDIFGGALVGLAAINSRRIWLALVRRAEKAANSWRCREYFGGRVRVMNHSRPAAAAAFAGMGLTAWLTGPELWPQLTICGLAIIAGAGLWGQWLEGGGHKLKRPFGFFGGLAALALAALACGSIYGHFWLLMGAALTAGPLVQALGRLRCLVQGCCHGRPISRSEYGLTVINPHSRAAGISGLAGVALYPTQLYSIVGNLVIIVPLARAWSLEAPLALICGLYLILSGALRFMEEAWRGEAQTPKYLGLPVYQWLAIVMVLAGFAISPLSSPPAPAAAPGLESLGPALFMGAAFALIAALALGVDLPKSERRFARLSD